VGYLGDDTQRLAALERDVGRLLAAAGLEPTPRPWERDPRAGWPCRTPDRQCANPSRCARHNRCLWESNEALSS